MARKTARDLESAFQQKLIERLEREFVGIFILKNDSGYIQGIPDLLLMYNDRWAALEVKPYATAEHEPNQDYYIDGLNQMSYGAFIYPENEEEIFHDLQNILQQPRRSTRVVKRQ